MARRNRRRPLRRRIHNDPVERFWAGVRLMREEALELMQREPPEGQEASPEVQEVFALHAARVGLAGLGVVALCRDIDDPQRFSIDENLLEIAAALALK